ncbi:MULTISPECIES: hypothetical protein [unclassified Rubrivivax]|uniref:hypothetical protein n=1 Tax=unclassified Rubrivivax TaxID=2649762 RepID=UPI001E3004AD|nr:MULTISPECIES: hypothetical protein [unclassified Rubrivivax]MCC9598881.1 hypothetical protein [Rubrivivax sp. JA1055]MCC9648581.1 hypothetical protein [Rubrivivax sp. JA1029]
MLVYLFEYFCDAGIAYGRTHKRSERAFGCGRVHKDGRRAEIGIQSIDQILLLLSPLIISPSAPLLQKGKSLPLPGCRDGTPHAAVSDYLHTNEWTGAIEAVVVSVNLWIIQEYFVIEVGHVSNHHFLSPQGHARLR